MSVICQNFVQNAWKKDLCSNCFKSVGDHENLDVRKEESENLNGGQNLNESYVTQESTIFPIRNTPHTTWKSLISEKNSKNSQPFKLENGFQGRLLTINKAINGMDKQNAPESNQNFTKNSVKEIVKKADQNGHSKKSENFSKPEKFNINQRNGTRVSEKSDKKSTDANIKKADVTKSYVPNGHQDMPNMKQNSTSEKEEENKSKSVHLHSILKKAHSTIQKDSTQTRRSNVGFKDEEPLIIGYGGRDFSPEELEWEMASSDGETENTNDSLDETEDDMKFSKMTKQNTEFNSDNTNLLKNNTKNQEKTPSSVVNVQNKNQTSTQNDTLKVEIEDHKKHEEKAKTAILENKKLTTDHKTEKTECKIPGSSENSINANSENFNAKMTYSELKCSADSINVAIKSDKISHAAQSEVTSTQPKPAGSPEKDKNSTPLINGAAMSLRSVSASDSTGRKDSEVVMFSDGDPTWQENASNEGNEWQNSNEISGQILQAINTSLTNRQEMRDQDSSREVTDIVSESKSEVLNSENASISSHIEKESMIQERSDNFELEPRTSFLHSIPSNVVSKPSAIYGPASDLFVSRSSSSSSSSSEGTRKSQISINVIVSSSESKQNDSTNESYAETDDIGNEHVCSHIVESSTPIKEKPKIPVKPTKFSESESNQNKKKMKDEKILKSDGDEISVTDEEPPENIENGYYSVSNASTITLVDHYAESNIYHEVNDKVVKIQEQEPIKVSGRESKLAALAIELEQVRLNGNTKRQAPAPPRVPDPPLEDPPSCTGRTSPIDTQNFPIFRGESLGFSSASSTTSTSSQDTETGYASWNLHGDSDDQPKHSKSKSSFLLSQYSKCKMLAMGYAEDSVKARKKFSLKKLLKLGKDPESPILNDNGLNSKAWKYSDNFDRPRAKLEIIHPMDLENKSVTINPGFDSPHCTSMTSFTNPDMTYRNSVSSDYGSFYSDTMTPGQDSKQEVRYDYIQSKFPTHNEQEESSSKAETSSSTSPTPSRSSLASQTSTVTSGSSKNGSIPPHRPPKPPPPPRAHSLLPGNKVMRNSDGTFKIPTTNGDASSSDEVICSPAKPQAPKRQCKSAILKSEYFNIEQNSNIQSISLENISENQDDVAGCIETETAPTLQNSLIRNEETLHQQETILSENSKNKCLDDSSEMQPITYSQEVILESGSLDGVYDNLNLESGNKTQANITIKNVYTQKDKFSKTMLTRNKHPPLTKSPARPPPIYSKPQVGNYAKNTSPWKTLEDSYLALTSSNRELLIKLASRRRKRLLDQFQKLPLQWTDFEIDTDEPSVFALGDKIAYYATVADYPEHPLTLVISIHEKQSQLLEHSEIKYPVFGKFTDVVPSELINNSDSELESMPATILILDRSVVTTIEYFCDNLPDTLTEDLEKEFCFIILQLIQSMKSLQAQGIESMDSDFQNLLLAKTKQDKYHTLIFLYDIYDESDYSSDSFKVSLCQYALLLLFQVLHIQSAKECEIVNFSTAISRKVFEKAIALLSEEKAVSLSQTKTLLECYLWGVTKVLESFQDSEECDNILHRWFDIERSNFIKSVINDEESGDISMQNEYYSQFLIRTTVRNIKEIALCL